MGARWPIVDSLTENAVVVTARGIRRERLGCCIGALRTGAKRAVVDNLAVDAVVVPARCIGGVKFTTRT